MRSDFRSGTERLGRLVTSGVFGTELQVPIKADYKDEHMKTNVKIRLLD